MMASHSAYLHQAGLEAGDLEGRPESERLHAELRRSASSAAAVQRVFAENRALFDTVEAAGLAFDDPESAEALLEELRAGRTRLAVTIPPTPRVLPAPSPTGYLGIVTRADLPAEVAEALFADGAGEFVGPVAYNRQYLVYQLLMARSAVLNAAVYEYCEELLVAEVLGARSDLERRHVEGRAPSESGVGQATERHGAAVELGGGVAARLVDNDAMPGPVRLDE